MDAIRTGASVVVAAGVAAGLYFACWEPLRINADVKSLQSRTIAALNRPDPFTTSAIAKENLRRLDLLGGTVNGNLDLLMIAAANFRILEENGAAANAYRRALVLERRPEIYFNLGEVLLATGDTAAAADAFARAAEFDLRLIADIPDPALRARVKARLADHFR